MKNFPRLVIAATQSGGGKTSLACGIISALKNRGLKVQAYKVGPDYIDTGFHKIASGRPSHNLDIKLVGRDKLREIFCKTSADCDISIIEGVMGLFDGGTVSTAEVAKILDAPIVLILDSKSVGESAAATALGFKIFDNDIKFAGVILNRIGSDSHKKIIFDSLEKVDIKNFGAVKRDKNFILPERHLGLVPTTENNVEEVIKKIGVAVEEQINLDELLKIANTATALNFENKTLAHSHKIPATRIAVARDEAFSFYYDESLSELENFGAEIIFFSPLRDKTLPKNISGLIFGGGFPEMFAKELEENKKIRKEIKSVAENNLPIFAECGGYMYLMESLKNFDEKIFEMCGVIPSRAEMTEKLQTVGYVDGVLNRDCCIGKVDDKFHAHEFHFSKEISTSDDKKIFDCEKLRTGEKYLAGFAEKNIVASYLHIHFSGCPSAAKNFVEACKKNK